MEIVMDEQVVRGMVISGYETRLFGIMKDGSFDYEERQVTDEFHI